MEQNTLYLFLAAVNAAAFLLTALDIRARQKGRRGLTAASLVLAAAGGALGAALAAFLLEKKAKKENMLLRTVSLTLLIMQIAAAALLCCFHDRALTFDLVAFFRSRPVLRYYLIGINLITFAVYGLDKASAIRQRRRVPIVTLLCLAAVGGSVGGLTGMALFRHKTRQSYFTVSLPLLLLMQLELLLLWMNLAA